MSRTNNRTNRQPEPTAAERLAVAEATHAARIARWKRLSVRAARLGTKEAREDALDAEFDMVDSFDYVKMCEAVAA